VASHLDVTYIGRVVFSLVIIVLQHTRGVEVVDEWLRGLVGQISLILNVIVENWIGKVFGRVEIFVDLKDLLGENRVLLPGIAVRTKASNWCLLGSRLVKGCLYAKFMGTHDKNYLSFWPNGVNSTDDQLVGSDITS
jgi:hypothetical protein